MFVPVGEVLWQRVGDVGFGHQQEGPQQVDDAAGGQDKEGERREIPCSCRTWKAEDILQGIEKIETDSIERYQMETISLKLEADVDWVNKSEQRQHDTSWSSALVVLVQYPAKYPSIFNTNTKEAQPKVIPVKNKLSKSPDSTRVNGAVVRVRPPCWPRAGAGEERQFEMLSRALEEERRSCAGNPAPPPPQHADSIVIPSSDCVCWIPLMYVSSLQNGRIPCDADIERLTLNEGYINGTHHMVQETYTVEEDPQEAPPVISVETNEDGTTRRTETTVKKVVKTTTTRTVIPSVSDTLSLDGGGSVTGMSACTGPVYRQAQPAGPMDYPTHTVPRNYHYGPPAGYEDYRTGPPTLDLNYRAISRNQLDPYAAQPQVGRMGSAVELSSIPRFVPEPYGLEDDQRSMGYDEPDYGMGHQMHYSTVPRNLHGYQHGPPPRRAGSYEGTLDGDMSGPGDQYYWGAGAPLAQGERGSMASLDSTLRKGPGPGPGGWRQPELPEVIAMLNYRLDPVRSNAAAYLQHLTYKNDKVHYAACGALKNISYGKDHDNKIAIKNCDGVPALVRDAVEPVVSRLGEDGDRGPRTPCPLRRGDGAPFWLGAREQRSGGGEENCKPRHLEWETALTNTAGCLRNVSSERSEARRKLRECTGLVDSLMYILIENSVCLLRNLSYHVHREIPGCERYQEAAPLNQGPAPSSQKGGCFSSRKSKGKKDDDAAADIIDIPKRTVPAKGYELLFQPEVVRIYTSLLKESKNPTVLEASAGAVQNLCAGRWTYGRYIRALLRHEKGLPMMTELLAHGNDRVVRAMSGALRNMAIDARNRDLLGKHAVPHLVANLPGGGQSQPVRALSEETVVSVLSTLQEVLGSSLESAKTLRSSQGIERLTVWGYKELRRTLEKDGWKKTDFMVNLNPPSNNTRANGGYEDSTLPLIDKDAYSTLDQRGRRNTLDNTLEPADRNAVQGGMYGERQASLPLMDSYDALSPYLSEKLSASMSPPTGQKRQLRLQALKGQTLLKLVSLLYSGELEVKGGVEQEDVLSVARKFGITDLVQRLEHLEEKQRNESRTMQDAQVQNEMAERRDQESPSRMGKCVSIGTQTAENIVGGYFTQSTQTEHPTPGPLSSGVQSMDFSLQSQNITLDKHFSSTSCPHIPTMYSNGESTLDCPSDSEENPTPALSSNVVTFPISLNEVAAHQQSSKCENTLQVLAKAGTKKGSEGGKTNGKRADNKENAEQPSHRDEMIRQGKGKSTLKRLAHVASKSMSKMKQVHHMMETTQISIKVKLKRNTETGEVWEVVSRRETEETLTLPLTLTQVDKMVPTTKGHRKTLQTVSLLPPLSSPRHRFFNLLLLPLNHIPPTPPLTPLNALPQSKTKMSSSQPPPKLPGPTEECDEQIDKLLEDIMMGLYILPDVERDCKKSHYHQPTQNEPTAICHAQASENEQPQSLMHSVPGACITRILGHKLIPHHQLQVFRSIFFSYNLLFPPPNVIFARYLLFNSTDQPNCASLSSVQPSSLLIHQQQRFPQCPPPFTAMVRKDGSSMPKTQNCPYPKAPTTRSVIPTALYSSGQKTVTTLTYYPVCQEPSAQGNPNILEFLPLTNGNEALSSHPLPSMDDLRLPPCLSPLDLPTINNSTHQSSKIQPHTTLDRRPWLTGNHGSLQYPLSAITPRPNKSASVPQYTNSSGRSRQWHLALNPQSCGTRAASFTVNEVEDRGAISAGPGNLAKPKSDPRIMKESLKKVEKIGAISAGPAHVAEEKSDPRKKRKRVEDIGAISAGPGNVAKPKSDPRIMKESLKKVEKIGAISAGPAHVAEEKSDPRKKRKRVEDIGAISAGPGNVAKLKSDPRIMKESLKKVEKIGAISAGPAHVAEEKSDPRKKRKRVEDIGAISAGPGNVAKPKSDPRIMKESLKKVEKIGAISAGPAHVAEEKSDPRKKRKRVKEVEDIGAISAGLPNVAEQESSSRKKTGGLKCKQVQDFTIDDAEVPKRRKRKRKSRKQEASSLLSLECVKVNNGTKEQTNLSIGSSSNNVLTKEREMADHSNKDLEKPDEPRSERGNQRVRDLKTEQGTWITTRGILKKTQETPSESSIEDSALKPKACIAQIVNEEGEPVKRGRGRPKNKKVVRSPPQSSPTAVEKISQDLNGEPQVDINFVEEVKDKTKPRSRKWNRNIIKVAAIPLKKTRSDKNTVKAVVDDNDVVIPAGRKRETTQKPQMVNLKEFQKLIKQRHSKASRSKESQENETHRTSRDVESEGKECGSRTEKLTKMDNAQSQNKDGIEESPVFKVPVDENHNRIFHKSTEECGQSRRDDANGTGLFGDEPPPVFSFEFLGEDQAKVAAEREHPLKNPDEGTLKVHDAGVSDTHHTSFNNEDSSHDTVGFCKTSGCDQEENEEEEEVDVEEEVEVDILHYSPDKVPPSRECLNGLDNIEITPEEEEEEEKKKRGGRCERC
ncbi:hypothetical protein F7725_005317 [Dissostichus mawsoni]|uniref:Uncharacterized protein n=1 Tax=Dissostichus mawsoni TaxID=36200 RepID=A0A7J5YQW7_DISMA|nr:hypothetical protein F7725_005317 [Dissostichus mawsoni]